MDGVVDDEKKPFDAEAEEDSQPDPDEQLMLDQGNGRVWLVKVREQFVVFEYSQAPLSLSFWGF